MASIRKRNGHYQITVSLGYDIYGKKLIETASFTPDPTRTEKQQERDLQQFARKFEEEVKSGIAQDGRRITFKAFSERCSLNMQELIFNPALSPSTHRSWRAKSILPSAI